MRNRKPFAAYLFVLAVTAAVAGTWSGTACRRRPEGNGPAPGPSHRPETRFTTGESEGVGAEGTGATRQPRSA